MPSLGFQIAASALVGNNIGAGNVELAKSYANWVQLLCLVSTFFMIVVTWFLRDQIAEFYTDS